MTPEHATRVVNSAIASVFSGTETDPRVFEWDVRTVLQAAVVAAITQGIPRAPLLALTYGALSAAQRALGRPLTEECLMIPGSISETLRGFDQVATALRDLFASEGSWADALSGYLFTHPPILLDHHVASLDETRAHLREVLQLLVHFERLEAAEMTAPRELN